MLLDKVPELAITGKPPVGFSFMAVFFIGGFVPNPFDIRFKKISGLSVEVQTRELKEGGQNHFVHRLPTGVAHGNLILERGMVVGSPLNIEFNIAMTTMTFSPSNVMVTLVKEKEGFAYPIAGWLCVKAYPVKWSVSDLDANENAVVIDTMELAYQRFQILRI